MIPIFFDILLIFYSKNFTRKQLNLVSKKSPFANCFLSVGSHRQNRPVMSHYGSTWRDARVTECESSVSATCSSIWSSIYQYFLERRRGECLKMWKCGHCSLQPYKEEPLASLSSSRKSENGADVVKNYQHPGYRDTGIFFLRSYPGKHSLIGIQCKPYASRALSITNINIFTASLTSQTQIWFHRALY